MHRHLATQPRTGEQRRAQHTVTQHSTFIVGLLWLDLVQLGLCWIASLCYGSVWFGAVVSHFLQLLIQHLEEAVRDEEDPRPQAVVCHGEPQLRGQLAHLLTTGHPSPQRRAEEGPAHSESADSEAAHRPSQHLENAARDEEGPRPQATVCRGQPQLRGQLGRCKANGGAVGVAQHGQQHLLRQHMPAHAAAVGCFLLVRNDGSRKMR